MVLPACRDMQAKPFNHLQDNNLGATANAAKSQQTVSFPTSNLAAETVAHRKARQSAKYSVRTIYAQASALQGNSHDRSDVY